MKRKRLFTTQGLLAVALIVLASIYYSISSEPGDLFKVVIAPFGAVSILIFCFFIFHRQVQRLDDELRYSPMQLILSILVAAISGTATAALIVYLGNFSDQLEHLVFGFAILVSCVIFAFDKIRNLHSMAMLSGIAEGVTLLLIFFDKNQQVV